MPRHRKAKQKKKLFRALTVTAVSLALLIVFVLVSLWLAYFIEQRFSRFLTERIFGGLEKVEGPNGVRLEEIITPSFPEVFLPPIFVRESADSPSREILAGRAFADSFSGFGWLDREATNLFHNFFATAFTFPAQYRWEEMPPGAMSPADFLRKAPDGSVAFCIEGNCLVERENRLFLNGEEIALPPGDRVHSVSVGTLGDRWLVGKVSESGGEYEGRVYFFDGENFEEAIGAEHFRSPYEGTLGFGGTEGDWLAFYGAYRGTAVQVLNGEILDISRFFSYRIMRNGFRPVAEKVSLGNETVWYVWSFTENKPILFKLMVDEKGAISGIFDLTNFLLSGFENVAFRPSNGGLFAKTNGGERFFRFIDLGFDKFGEGRVASLNINNIPGEIREASVEGLGLLNKGNDFRILLSNDGEEWIEAEVGETVVFPNRQGRFLFWQAVILPGSDPHEPFFLNNISINFKQKPL